MATSIWIHPGDTARPPIPGKEGHVSARDAVSIDTEYPEQDAIDGRDDHGVLDRRVNLSAAGWFGVLGALGVAAAFALRFIQLDAIALSPREGEWAYDAWSFYTGKPHPGGEQLPLVGPLFLILEAAMFFLFGVSDATARAVPAIAGVGIVGLILALRPFLSRSRVAGMVVLAALSPSLVFAARTVDPNILVAFWSLAAVVTVLRAGAAQGTRAVAWSALLGVSIGGMLASGPEGVSAIITIVIALAAAGTSDAAGARGNGRGPVASGLGAIFGSARATTAFLASLVATVLLAFTRLFSDVSALEGVLTTFGDWARLLTTQSSNTPIQFFLTAMVLYELLALVFAAVAVLGPADHDDLNDTTNPLPGPTLFVAWFVAALAIQSFSSGRHPDQTVLVALPLVLLGGIGLGRLGERIPWRSLATTRAGLAPVAIFGILIGVIAAITFVARENDPASGVRAGAPAWLQVAFVLLLIVVPLSALLASEFTTPRRARQVGWSALLVLGLLLAAYTVRTTSQLSYVRADRGTELLAPNVPTQGVRDLIAQTRRLSRDLSLTDVSNIDNTGSYGVSIAIDPSLESPLAWYFRDFPNVAITAPAGWAEADMVIAPTAEGMEETGFIDRTRTWLNRVPSAYEELDIAGVASYIVSPSKWYEGIRYLVHRDLPVAPVPEQISVGYTFRLSNQLNPSDGPFDLFTGQAIGAGSALGQTNGPAGIALDGGGETVYVVDAGNQRIQRYARDGAFIGVWGPETDPRLALGFSEELNQGASDIIVDDDGLVYVADTWSHRVLVLDADGQVVREIGRTGELTDIGDSVDPGVQTGLFFGPRGIALSNGEIFVTDTGNERVQVFGPDGTFLRAFGGFGSEPGKLVEPVGIAIGPDDNVYVADSGNTRLSVFTKDGTPVTQIPVESWTTQGERLNYIRFGPDGVLYMTSPGGRVVEAYSIRNGEIEEVADGGPDGGVGSPAGIAVASDGTLLVTDTSASTIEEVVPVLPEGFGGGMAASPIASPPPEPGRPPR